MGMELSHGVEIPSTKNPEPWEMTFEDFKEEYERVMNVVAAKEKLGHLDPAQPDYVPMSDAERQLLEYDWKAFSRARGFSEQDIKEYERWLTLSGQRDAVEGAINDPWRRDRSNHVQSIYRKLVEYADAHGIAVSDEVMRALPLRNERGHASPIEHPSAPDPSSRSGSEDIW